MVPPPLKPEINLAVFHSVDLRFGTIESACAVEESHKLIKLVVDFGDHKRTVLSGMQKDRPDFQQVVGKQALFVINLPPRKMAGYLSEGMIIDVDTEKAHGSALVVPEMQVSNGSRAG